MKPGVPERSELGPCAAFSRCSGYARYLSMLRCGAFAMRRNLGLLLALVALGTPQIAVARTFDRSANTARVEQLGDQNVALVRQVGEANQARLIQSGAQNFACLVQIGRELTLSLAQTGDGEELSLMQTRGATHALPTQACRAVARDRAGEHRDVTTH